MWKTYRRKEIVEARPYRPGEDLRGMIIPEYINPVKDQGMIVRPKGRPHPQWYLPRKAFESEFEPHEG